jgi:hypothetical protein
MKVAKFFATTLGLLALVYLVIATFLPEYMIVGFKIPKF